MAKSQGWIKVFRDILDHWIWQDPMAFRCWMFIILKANHSDKKIIFDGSLITIRRGQLLTSIRKLSDEIGCSKDKMRKILETLISDNMISVKTTHRGTLLTVINYEKFQGSRDTEQYAEQYAEQYTERSQNSTQNLPKQEYKECNKNDKEKKEAAAPALPRKGRVILEE
jgi:DNA replication protein DnaD